MTRTNTNNGEKTTEKRKKNHEKKKHKIGTKANTNQSHLSLLLFGGPGQFVTRTGEIKTVRFGYTFSEGLSYDYLRRGAEKTGYIPNTRCLLKSQKQRHELFEDADDEKKLRIK